MDKNIARLLPSFNRNDRIIVSYLLRKGWKKKPNPDFSLPEEPNPADIMFISASKLKKLLQSRIAKHPVCEEWKYKFEIFDKKLTDYINN